jgi:hypothetical protein
VEALPLREVPQEINLDKPQWDLCKDFSLNYDSAAKRKMAAVKRISRAD